MSVLNVAGGAWDRARAIWLPIHAARFSVIGVGMLALILLIDQSRDAVCQTEASGLGAILLFTAAVSILAFQAWWWARFLLDLRPPAVPEPHYADPETLARWHRAAVLLTPRLVGLLAYGAAIWTAHKADCDGQWLAIGLLAAAAAAFYILVTWRRARLNATLAGGAPGAGGTTAFLRSGHSDPLAAAREQSREAIAAGPADPVASAENKRDAVIALAALTLLVIAAALLSSPLASRLGGSPHAGSIAAWSFLAIGLFFWLGLANALQRTRAVTKNAPAGTYKGFLGGREWIQSRFVIHGLMILNGILFGASVICPAAAGMTLGASVVLVASAGVLVGTASAFLGVPAMALHLPVARGVLMLMLAVGLFQQQDNHAVRALAPAGPADGGGAPAGLDQALDRWYEGTAPVSDGRGGSYRPMILVAAEGGASRSAYWTSLVLGKLTDNLPGFRQHLFAVVGVSGGGLGVTVYHQLLAAQQAGPLVPDPLCRHLRGEERLPVSADGDTVVERSARCILQNDFLGPTFLSMLNGDLIQRLIPGDILPDRAYALETSWERAWRLSLPGDALSGPVAGFRRPAAEMANGEAWLPVLVVAGTSAKTGRRILTASIDTAGAFPDAADFFALTGADTRFSTAAHNGARFPYISPAGSLWGHGDTPPRMVDRIVDGGYFENSGLSTAADIVARARLVFAGKPDPVRVLVLYIQNDPQPPGTPPAEAPGVPADEKTAIAGMGKFAPEVTTPPVALFTARDGRGVYAEDVLRDQAAQPFDPQVTLLPLAAINLVHLCPDKNGQAEDSCPDPAMSWLLSDRSLKSIAESWPFGPDRKELPERGKGAEAVDAVQTLLGVSAFQRTAR